MSQQQEAHAAPDGLGGLREPVRRVARLVTGSWDGVDDLLARIEREVAQRVDYAPGGGDHASTVWRVAATLLAQEPQQPAPEPSGSATSDTAAGHLAPLLAALSPQNRLAIALVHAGGLGLAQLGDALGLSTDKAETRLSIAEAHLSALARAKGDRIDIQPDH